MREATGTPASYHIPVHPHPATLHTGPRAGQSNHFHTFQKAPSRWPRCPMDRSRQRGTCGPIKSLQRLQMALPRWPFPAPRIIPTNGAGVSPIRGKRAPPAISAITRSVQVSQSSQMHIPIQTPSASHPGFLAKDLFLCGEKSHTLRIPIRVPYPVATRSHLRGRRPMRGPYNPKGPFRSNLLRRESRSRGPTPPWRGPFLSSRALRVRTISLFDVR